MHKELLHTFLTKVKHINVSQKYKHVLKKPTWKIGLLKTNYRLRTVLTPYHNLLFVVILLNFFLQYFTVLLHYLRSIPYNSSLQAVLLKPDDRKKTVVLNTD